MRVRLGLLLALFVGIPAGDVHAQHFAGRASAACRCEPSANPRKPRFLLPVAGIGFLPAALAARDSLLPSLGLPSLVGIRGGGPRTALEGQRQLAVGALAPDTATMLPTVMLTATLLILSGAWFMMPRRRRRQLAFWRDRSAGGPHRGLWRLRTAQTRRIGVVTASFGGLVLLLGVREYAEGAQAQRRARSEWNQMGSGVLRVNDSGRTTTPAAPATLAATNAPRRDSRSVVPLPVLAVSGREIRRGAAVARLYIPSISLDEIVMEGVGPVELNGGPGHFPGSVLPGASGNSIISAHRDRHFSRLGELNVGARIRTETREETVEWVVTGRRVVSKDTPALFEQSDATLTLTTCWPIRYFGPAPDRLLVVAKRAS